MRKEFVGHRKFAGKSPGDAEWLDLESIAHAQITSEDPAFPIENALSTNPEGNELGWRADSPGRQTITLLSEETEFTFMHGRNAWTAGVRWDRRIAP